MTRTVAREIAVRLCFGITDRFEAEEMLDAFFDREYYKTLSEEDELYVSYPEKKQLDYIRGVVMGSCDYKRELDNIIQTYSQGWKISRISRIAATILRTALYEIMFIEDIPAKVSINEAVELAKNYEEAETVSFINGILGSYMRAEKGGEEVCPNDPCEETQTVSSEAEASDEASTSNEIGENDTAATSNGAEAFDEALISGEIDTASTSNEAEAVDTALTSNETEEAAPAQGGSED